MGRATRVECQALLSVYRRAGGKRSYTWVKCELQKSALGGEAPKRGAHRKRRDRAPCRDAAAPRWQPARVGGGSALGFNCDDGRCTNEHYAMQFVEEEARARACRGGDVIREHGLFSAFYSDRGSHYWLTPEAAARWIGAPRRSLDAPCSSWALR